MFQILEIAEIKVWEQQIIAPTLAYAHDLPSDMDPYEYLSGYNTGSKQSLGMLKIV